MLKLVNPERKKSLFQEFNKGRFYRGAINMTRRVTFTLVLILLLSLAVLAGPKIEVWEVGLANETISIIKDLIAQDFTPTTGIEVSISVFPWEGMFNKVLLAMASNSTPDIIAGAPDHLVEYGVRSGVLDLKENFGAARVQALEKKLYPGTTKALNFRGNTFGFVENAGVIIGYYRTDILRDLGMAIPKTWNELHAIQPKLKARNMSAGWGYGGINGGPEWGSYLMMKQNNGSWVDGETYKSRLLEDNSVQGFKNYVELYTKHGIPQEGISFQMFKTGEWPILMDISAFYANVYLAAPELHGKWQVDLIPGTVRKDGSVNHESFMGGSTLGIAKNAKNKEAAFKYMEWYLSDEVQSQLVKLVPEKIKGAMIFSGNIAATQSLPIPSSDKQKFYEQLNVSNAFSYFPGGSAVQRELNFAVHNVLQKKIAPEEALKIAARNTEQELSRKQKEYQRYIDKLAK